MSTPWLKFLYTLYCKSAQTQNLDLSHNRNFADPGFWNESDRESDIRKWFIQIQYSLCTYWKGSPFSRNTGHDTSTLFRQLIVRLEKAGKFKIDGPDTVLVVVAATITWLFDCYRHHVPWMSFYTRRYLEWKRLCEMQTFLPRNSSNRPVNNKSRTKLNQ